MRTGRIRSAAPRLGRLRDGGTGKRSFKELHPQEEDEEPRRSTRHADKRVRWGVCLGLREGGWSGCAPATRTSASGEQRAGHGADGGARRV